MMRLFIAIEVPADIEHIFSDAQNELKRTNADIKWVDPKNIHLTLKFLGHVDDNKVPDIKMLMDNLAKNYHIFTSSLFKIGAFPDINYPRAIWIGVDKNCSLVEEIAKKLEEQLSTMGFQKEKRSYAAHFTLGRTRSEKNRDSLREKLTSIEITQAEFGINSLTLFKSQLTPRGPIYTRIHTSGLKP